ncbi:MAG TPA: hypothetical protein VFX17_02085 [Patescibacteria group bacterium]|nr:hypothetical protein [Patescibacteria group bacterium]
MELKPGAKEGIRDPRNYKLSFVASSVAPIDWNKPVILPRPPDTNQHTADDCVGEGNSKVHWRLEQKQFSVKSLFSNIAFPEPGQGANLADGPNWICKYGQQTLDQLPDPEPKNPINMRDKNGQNPAQALVNREKSYFDTNGTIEQIAQAIRDFGNVTFGLAIGNTGWEDYTYPNPPSPNAGGEGHCLSGKGYHICKDGQKCIITDSSFVGAQSGHFEHHIRENYFNSGYIFKNAYILLKRSNMIARYIVQKGGKLGVLVSVDGDGIFTDTVFWAKSDAMFEDLKKQYEVPDDAPRIVYPV